MSNEQKRTPTYARSKKTVPFCPDCGVELNSLDMFNCFDTCKCGEWWDGNEGVYFRPYKEEKPYKVIVNGVEQS